MTSRRRIAWTALFHLLLAMLCLAAPIALAAPPPPAPSPVEGTDYFLIDNPAPLLGRKVQVVEVFGYGCPICARFQPFLTAWERKLPADVAFSYLPAAFGPDPEHCWDEFARAWFAARTMGLKGITQERIYAAKFEQGRVQTCDAIPSVYADFGAEPGNFASTMQSFPVTSAVANAHDQVLRWGVDGTPSIVVDGTYRAIMTRHGGPEGLLRTVDWLIGKQRVTRAGQHRGKR